MENPKPHGKSYNKWLGEQAKPSHREQLRVMIDRALEQKPADFDTLLQLLSEMGCEVSRRGKAIRPARENPAAGFLREKRRNSHFLWRISQGRIRIFLPMIDENTRAIRYLDTQ